jgi:CRISPR-associated protein Cas2
MYDIEDDKKRKKIADACLDYGLDRIQYSVFYGDISRNYQQELFQIIKRTLGKKNGKLMLIPISQNEWKKRMLHEKGDLF